MSFTIFGCTFLAVGSADCFVASAKLVDLWSIVVLYFENDFLDHVFIENRVFPRKYSGGCEVGYGCREGEESSG